MNIDLTTLGSGANNNVNDGNVNLYIINSNYKPDILQNP